MNRIHELQLFRQIFLFNREIHGNIIYSIRNFFRDNLESYRISYLDNNLEEEKWMKKIAKNKILLEKKNSLIEILEMYVTVSSDLIRQIHYENRDLNEFYTQHNIFYQHFRKCLDSSCTIFGGCLPDFLINKLDLIEYYLNYFI